MAINPIVVEICPDQAKDIIVMHGLNRLKE